MSLIAGLFLIYMIGGLFYIIGWKGARPKIGNQDMPHYRNM